MHKEKVQQVVGELPEEVDVDRLVEKLYLEKIELGEQQLAREKASSRRGKEAAGKWLVIWTPKALDDFSSITHRLLDTRSCVVPCPGDSMASISAILHDQRIAFVGKLASMRARRRAIGPPARGDGAGKPDASAHLIVIGEEEFLWPKSPARTIGSTRPHGGGSTKGDRGIAETQLWQRLGLVESQHEAHRLYTPAMLAELLKVPVVVIRRWRRRGLIVPVHECGGCRTSIFRKYQRGGWRNCWRRACRPGDRKQLESLAATCPASPGRWPSSRRSCTARRFCCGKATG